MVAKRDDPNYKQLQLYLPIEEYQKLQGVAVVNERPVHAELVRAVKFHNRKEIAKLEAGNFDC